MHPSAMDNGISFFDTYKVGFQQQNIKVVDIGSQDVNGSLREVCPVEFEYIGVDFQKAKGVDIVLNDPYSLPFENESVDIVLSSSCFEHSELFWLTFLEIMRVLKPHGLFYFNAPSSGVYHAYPVDCWRFFPDSGSALINWARRNNINALLLESYIQKGGGWEDFVAVFLKEQSMNYKYSRRILDNKIDCEHSKKY